MTYMFSAFDQSCTTQSSFGEVVQFWRGDGENVLPSQDWLSRATSVRYRYDLVLDRLLDSWADIPMIVFEDPRAKVLIWSKHEEKSNTPCAANELIRVLRAFFEFARRHALIGRNPTAGLKEYGCARGYGEVFWTDEEIERFAAEAAKMGMLGLGNAIKLVAVTGLSVNRAINLKRSQVQDFAIVIEGVTRKGSKRTSKALPLIPEAKQFIKELRAQNGAEADQHVLLTDAGTSWEYKRFYRFAKIARDNAAIVHEHEDDNGSHLEPKRFQALTKTYAVKLMKLGLSDSEIISLVNWTHLDVANLRKAAGCHEPRCGMAI